MKVTTTDMVLVVLTCPLWIPMFFVIFAWKFAVALDAVWAGQR